MNGYNDSYAAYYLRASDDGRVAFSFTPASGTSVADPIFVVQNYTGGPKPAIAVNDNPITVNAGVGSGAFVSINRDANELWVTLKARLSTSTTLAIQP